jgi:tetratricopeptide (TPR) repeat protein
MKRIAPAFLLVAATVCLPCLLKAQQGLDDVVEARRLLLEASHLVKDIPKVQQASAVANIASQLMRAGDLPDALATTRLLKDPNDLALANGSVAWQLANTGSFPRALALVESASDGPIVDGNYQTLAGLAAHKGDLEVALKIAHRIPPNSVELTEALLRVAIEAAKGGDVPRAREVIGEALRTCEAAILENGDKALELPQIARTQIEIGDTPGAGATLSRFSDIAPHRKTDDASRFLEQLGSVQAQMGDIVGAQGTLRELPPGLSDGVLSAISEEQAKQDLVVDALASSARLSNPQVRSASLRQIAIIRGAQGTLHDAREAIDQISQPAARAEAVATLALQQAINENPAASSTLQVAWEFATVPGSDTSWYALQEIAVTRAILKDFAGAQQIVRSMTDLESRMWPLWNITSMMVDAGQTQEAIALAEDQDSAYPKAYALLGTASGILDRLEVEAKARAGKH